MKQETAAACMTLLNRVDLKGSEVMAFTQIMNELNEIANPTAGAQVPQVASISNAGVVDAPSKEA